VDSKRTKIGPTGPVRGTGFATGTAPEEAPAEPPAEPPTEPVAPAAAPVAAAPPAASPAHLPTAEDPLLGKTLADRYQIVRKLGEGGMGAVYLATHQVLEKQVALKVLHGEFARKPDLVERFMQEAKSASRIRHENVIDISDFGSTAEGHVFFAMELLSGHDLHEVIARARLAGQLLPWTRSKRIFLQICGALSAAHRSGIVHRDLKPENVYLVEFLGEADFVKLLDFGIAKLTETEAGERKLTRTGMLFGTPEYMSPEQARGEHVDHRVDIYAMGCILFQLVSGRVPFEADNFMGVLTLHLTQPPPVIPPETFDRIGAPRELADVIAQALAKDRAHRFQSIDDLGNAVRVVSGEAPIAPGKTGPVSAQRPRVDTAQPLSVGSSPSPTPVPDAPLVVSTTGRVRTQWTGTLSVPQADEPPPVRQRSKLPLAVGAVVLAAGAAAALVIAKRGGDGAATGSGAASGSAVVVAGGGTEGTAGARPRAADAPDAAVAPVAPQEAPLPETVTVTLDSQPRGAIVKDLVSGVVFGPTPRRFPVTPSRKPRQYLLTLRGYADAQIELVPDREAIERTETLAKSAGEKPGPGKPGSGRPGPEGKADPGTPQIKPPPSDEDCPELPCLKSDPTRKGGSGGS
jgi:eukaryotic-like serine/threonine-protein kinase